MGRVAGRLAWRARVALVLGMWLAGAWAAHATHGQLDDKIGPTASGYRVYFTDDAPYTPPPGPGADLDFFPAAQAQNIANAFENGNAPTPGAPNGHHAGFLNLGFTTPRFVPEGGRGALILDCTPHGGCDNGQANIAGIQIPAPNYIGSTEACLRLVAGHELFHHVQYAYISSNGTAWGKTAMEGTARLMQDKVYTDLDGNAGCITYLAQVNSYLGDPNQDIWQASYSSALFWNYLTEQFGTNPSEPQRGVDFIRRFWHNAESNAENPDTPGTVLQTIQATDPGASLVDVFQDFAHPQALLPGLRPRRSTGRYG